MTKAQAAILQARWELQCDPPVCVHRKYEETIMRPLARWCRLGRLHRWLHAQHPPSSFLQYEGLWALDLLGDDAWRWKGNCRWITEAYAGELSRIIERETGEDGDDMQLDMLSALWPLDTVAATHSDMDMSPWAWGWSWTAPLRWRGEGLGDGPDI